MTRAFVLRDINLIYSLFQSAFSLLNLPTIVPDSLSDHRRKWDMLRIAFESTVYLYFSTVIHRVSAKNFCTSLMESPQTLATSIYSRYWLSHFPTRVFRRRLSVLPSSHIKHPSVLHIEDGRPRCFPACHGRFGRRL